VVAALNSGATGRNAQRVEGDDDAELEGRVALQGQQLAPPQSSLGGARRESSELRGREAGEERTRAEVVVLGNRLADTLTGAGRRVEVPGAGGLTASISTHILMW